MADDVQDIYIATEAGDAGWQSLSALAAEQVEAHLPIESVDGTVVLSDSSGSFVVSTGGEERVKVKPASYGSAAVTIGEDHVQTIGGISVKNDPTQVDYTSQMQFRFVDENDKYAYTGMTEPRFNGGSPNALISGGVFFAGHDNGDAVIFSKTNDVIIATGGLAASNERLRITDDYVQSAEKIKTPSISGTSSNDASVTLGDQTTLTKGDGSEYVVTDAASIATKKYVDDKIVVCTSAEYAAISPKLSGTLYCLTD